MSVFIVAEAGVNHLGDRAKMLALCDAAKAAGADAVKFQAYSTDKLIERRGKGDRELLAKCELKDADFIAIAHHCIDLGLLWFASIFDETQPKRLFPWRPAAYKLSHVESGDKSLREAAASLGLPVFASFSCKADVRDGCAPVYCPSGYPAEGAFLSHAAMDGWRGFSSHFADYRKPAAACVGRQQFYLEAHMKLSDTDPEAAWSLSVEDFGKMVKLIREYETWL